MEKLFISDEALKLKGKEYFRDDEYEDYSFISDPEDAVELEDGLLLARDDMDNLYICAGMDDICFNDIDDVFNRE